MSVNINFSFEIHKISWIHEEGNDELRNRAIKETEAFLEGENMHLGDFIIDFLGQEGYLAAYSTYPVIISRSYLYIPEVTKRWEEHARKLFGERCEPKMNEEYPDEEI